MEAHKLRMDRLEIIIDDHRKELANVKDRVAAVEKKGGGSVDTLALKVEIASLGGGSPPVHKFDHFLGWAKRSTQSGYDCGSQS